VSYSTLNLVPFEYTIYFSIRLSWPILKPAGYQFKCPESHYLFRKHKTSYTIYKAVNLGSILMHRKPALAWNAQNMEPIPLMTRSIYTIDQCSLQCMRPNKVQLKCNWNVGYHVQNFQGNATPLQVTAGQVLLIITLLQEHLVIKAWRIKGQVIVTRDVWVCAFRFRQQY